MSNPAVIKLVKKKVNRINFWIDDNIGESIHIHINSIRLDMTIDEFNMVASQVNDIITGLVDVEGFNSNNFNATYMSLFLHSKMFHISKIKVDKVRLSELKMRTKRIKTKMTSVADSPVLKALKGDSRANNIPKDSDYLGQSRDDRAKQNLHYIETNGYPKDGQYIVLYNDENIISDGQHRAACLYYLYGDIEVPVVRIYHTYKDKRSAIRKLLSKQLKRFINVAKYFWRVCSDFGCDSFLALRCIRNRKLVKIYYDD